jgi:hypothetical protein
MLEFYLVPLVLGILFECRKYGENNAKCAQM